MKKRRRKTEEEIEKEEIRNIRKSMKTVMKKRRRKTEEDKIEKKLMKTIERADFEYNRNDEILGQHP